MRSCRSSLGDSSAHRFAPFTLPETLPGIRRASSRLSGVPSMPGSRIRSKPTRLVYCWFYIPDLSGDGTHRMARDPSQLSVLAIHAHPDDVEIQCAGTLARLKSLGCRISIATMTPGDLGSAELPPDEIAAVRRGEAQRAADLIGA